MKSIVVAISLAIGLLSLSARADSFLWFFLGSDAASHHNTTVTEYKDKTSLEIDSIQDRIKKERYFPTTDVITWDLTGFDENKQALISHFKNQGFGVKLIKNGISIETGYFTAQQNNAKALNSIIREHTNLTKIALFWLFCIYLIACFLVVVKELIRPSYPTSKSAHNKLKSIFRLRINEKNEFEVIKDNDNKDKK